MTFELFNAYVTKNRIIPTNEQKTFFNNRLILLDPNNNGKIAGKTAVQFLTMTGLSNQQIRQIWSIANPSKNQHLTYQDMQVALRLVSYAQAGIQLSKQNVQLNLKCNLPQLMDQQDQDQGSHPPPPVNTSNKNPQQQQFFPPKPKSLFSQNQFQQYQKYWQTLENKSNQLISGNQVKKIYQTAANKTSLATAWKLCSNTQKGYLSKGQLFIFIHLTKLLKQNSQLPSQLSKQMKDAILRFDKQTVQKRKSKQLMQGNTTNRSQSINIGNQKIQSLQKRIKDVKKNETSSFNDLSNIKNNNILNLIDDVQNFIKEIQISNTKYQKQIHILKQKQQQISDRLSTNILRLKKIIQKQNIFIEELIAQIKTKQQIDSARIKSVQIVQQKNFEKPKIQKIQNKVEYKKIQQIQKPQVIQIYSKQPQFKQATVQQYASKQTIKSIQQQKKIQSSSQSQIQSSNQISPQTLYNYQMQTFKLLYTVKPMTQQQIPQYQQRIFSMSFQQLQVVYAKLIQTYQQQQKVNQINSPQYVSRVQQSKPSQIRSQVKNNNFESKIQKVQSNQQVTQKQQYDFGEHPNNMQNGAEFNFDDFKKQQKHTQQVDFWN